MDEFYPDEPPRLEEPSPNEYPKNPALRCTAVRGCPRRWIGYFKSVRRPRNSVQRFFLGDEHPPVYYCLGHVAEALDVIKGVRRGRA